jgi:hypothetical protein
VEAYLQSPKCRTFILPVIYLFTYPTFCSIVCHICDIWMDGCVRTYLGNRGTRYNSWLRHYAKRRKVAGSIPFDGIRLHCWPNPSSHTTALGSTQPPSVIFLGVNRGQRMRLTTSPPSLSRLSRKCGNLDVSQFYGPPRPITGLILEYCTLISNDPVYFVLSDL